MTARIGVDFDTADTVVARWDEAADRAEPVPLDGIWLNEDSPTFLDVDPPAAAGVARFSLDFRIDAQKRLTVSAFDIERRIWVLDRQPVVRLA